MKVLRLLFCLTFLGLSASAWAQKPKPADFGIKSKKALKYYLEGMQQTQWRARDEAIESFKAALEIEPEFGHAHFQLGINAYVRKRNQEALAHMEITEQTVEPGTFPLLPFYLGELYFRDEQYAEAIPRLIDFLEAGKGRKVMHNQAQATLRHARFAAGAIQNPVDFEPLNMGANINSDRDEYLPHLTADDQFLLFTSRRPGSVGGFNRSLQGYSEDFFFSEYVDGAWQKAQNLGEPINTAENEGAASIRQDGRVIYFTACNLPGGEGNCDLYVSYRNGDSWSKPENLGPGINSEGWDSQPCLSPDGKRLFFASNRAGGLGGRDIWFTERIQDRWSTPQNLGAPVNTSGNEDSPFLHADGLSLYFSSDHHPGFGSQDLFVSFRQGDNWSEPVNLGYPLNTSADESNIYVSASGRQGFINSDREGGFGRSDLYQFEMDQRIRPRIATFLRGLTIDSLTETPVYSRIRLIDVETGDTIRDMRSGRSDGRFLMSLPLEKEYAAIVTAPGYLFVSQNFYLKDMVEETYFDLIIPMLKVKKGIPVVLKNIFFETNRYQLKETSKAELAFLLYYLQTNPELKIEISGHTDDVGSDTDNQTLSQRRAEAVKAYLVSEGIRSDRIRAVGYGESKPIRSNDTDEGRAQNRRTEFVILEL
jgi:outer membrane protein OmpA-like peptidoglycan-associated protein